MEVGLSIFFFFLIKKISCDLFHIDVDERGEGGEFGKVGTVWRGRGVPEL
jgi:hypothetical protein